jgi:hypothetical protein
MPSYAFGVMILIACVFLLCLDVWNLDLQARGCHEFYCKQGTVLVSKSGIL